MGKFKDITGQHFGRLTAIKYMGDRKWLFRCDCGNEKIIRTYAVKSGRTQSCGCYMRERINEACTTHNMTGTKLYHIYASMKQRCFNENQAEYHRYGGRGITMCEEWLGKNGFQKFSEWAYSTGYDENAERGECTIDRINNDGNYEPSNCRWITQKEQQNNKSEPQVVICGESHSMKEWSKITGLSITTIRGRMKEGWKEEEILSVPQERETRVIHSKSQKITYNGETHTIVEWAKILGVSNNVLTERVRRGYTDEEIICMKLGKRRNSSVVIENIETGERKEFESQKEAADYIGTTLSNVNKCVRGKMKKTHGYKIFYKENI